MTNSSDMVAEIPPTVVEPKPGKPTEDRLTRAARTLPRRRFFNDMPDKGLFAFAALVGFAGIIALKTRSPMSAELIAAMAVSIMLLYGVVVFQMPAVQMRPDRLGDNFYYLGFIYTLASLSAALIQLRTAPQIEDLLGNFGIALVTTVVGVAGRVLFVQMRGELDEIEEHVRRDLVAASTDLRAQLSLALNEFQTFHVATLQASGETLDKATKQAAAHVGLIGTLAESAGKSIGAAIVTTQQQAERLAELLTRIEDAIGQLPLLGKIELPSERLERQVASFTQELESLVAELRNAMDEYGRYRRGRRRWYWPFRR